MHVRVQLWSPFRRECSNREVRVGDASRLGHQARPCLLGGAGRSKADRARKRRGFKSKDAGPGPLHTSESVPPHIYASNPNPAEPTEEDARAARDFEVLSLAVQHAYVYALLVDIHPDR